MADPSGGREMVMRESRKGNWTVSETLVLIEAKKMDDERRVRRSEKQPEGRNKPAELRWKWIEEYCWRRGCQRNQNQCNDKWDNLMRDYKKIREYERSRVESSFNTSSSCSYWKIDKSEKKEKNLPSNMLPQIYDALAELVDRNTLPSSSSSAAVGNGNGSQILRVCQQNLAFVPPMMAQPKPMHQIPTTIVLTYPPPPPQSLSISLPPPPQPPPSSPFHVEPIQPTVDTSRGKRRRTTPGETTAGGEREAEEDAFGVALSRCTSVITQVIRESEERQERRHKEVVKLQERRLKIEESKAEINRQGISGLVDAINQLATSILALASSSCHNNHNHQGGPP
ncbi:Myb-like domain [Arabidopsis suecica]|uniref:Myb-like domain n=1 Tax=Arabidopsis suecica TaxID=45249 RepID=A0A8T2AJU0_ARASU|nr:Myb-like domain [Arabidopsis suecica]